MKATFFRLLGVEELMSAEEDSSEMEVEETGCSSVDEGDGEMAADWLLKMSELLKMPLEEASSSSCELEAAAIRLEATRESVANFERIGFTFTRIGRREEPGRLPRTELLLAWIFEEELGEMVVEEALKMSLLSRGVSTTTADDDDAISGELKWFTARDELTTSLVPSKEGVRLGEGVGFTSGPALASTEVGLMRTSRTMSKEM